MGWGGNFEKMWIKFKNIRASAEISLVLIKRKSVELVSVLIIYYYPARSSGLQLPRMRRGEIDVLDRRIFGNSIEFN